MTRLLTALKVQVQGKAGRGTKVESPKGMSPLLVRLPPALVQHQQNLPPVQVSPSLSCCTFNILRINKPVFPCIRGVRQYVLLCLYVAGSRSASTGEVSVYVDLTYIPSGASSTTVSVDFFSCVRSSCYIISGNSPEREELMRQTLDALLDGKMSWSDSMQVEMVILIFLFVFTAALVFAPE